MARALVFADLWPNLRNAVIRKLAGQPSEPREEFRRLVLWIIAGRAFVQLFGINLAEPLGLFPQEPGPGGLLFVPALNLLTSLETVLYLALWWSRRWLFLQLCFQIAFDLCFTTLLVANTHGIDSPFISLYLLIVLYSSLALGRNGGLVSAALSAILYTTLLSVSHLGWLGAGDGAVESGVLSFRIFFHALGFFSVAFLGTYLSQRLHTIERELEEKIESLDRLQRLNEHIVGSIRSGLVTTDLEGKIAAFNKAAEEITGLENSSVLGTPVQRLIGGELWGMILGTGWLRDSRPLRHQAWFSFPLGGRRFLGFSISPLVVPRRRKVSPDDGALLGYIVAFQDLTEIKRLEEEIRLKERMAAIGRMAAGIAHEIRNPLTSMRGSVEVLRSHLELKPADARLMDILVRESDRLNAFVEDFLSFARPRRYVREPVEVTALLRDTCTLLCNSAEVKAKHTIELELKSPVMVHGSPDQLRQVFWNLAQNALRAMPAGGRLRIEARSASEGGGIVVFEDTGVGMTQEEREQIFHPFHPGFQGGTGLGLSIVFQIVEDHQGKIYFESEKGRGTRVTLSIPAEAPAAATVEV